MKEIIENIKKTFELAGFVIASVQYCPDDGSFIVEGFSHEGVFIRSVKVQYLIVG
jgi:uncharacterized protein YkuJ